ncbi:MAG TPA: hypothetical protein DCE56_14810 [Cyanobacteria bacterium UBA8553]|nr:hypothetical protein [Cyanobacteria bacterium UBA8553]HAJ58695.1 hypothetical protein [Cyanobacteria bacterium UBA8543]
MDTITLNSKHKNPYRGINWYGVREPLPIKPEDSLICCDLRNCNFNGLDLSMVEFFGCRLNGTSFQGATMRGTKFIGCFSAHNAQPTDFRNSIWQEVFVVDSHLNYLSDQNLSDSWLWPAEVAAAATETLSERNDVRYQAASKLGDLDNPVIAPILACLLTDKEWDVRTLALEVLGKLRHKQFPCSDHALLEWMFLSLGDSHSIVRQTAIELVETLSPPDDVLRPSIERMRASSSEQRREGVLAAIELCELDGRYSRLLDRNTLESLLVGDESSEVRSQCAYLLEILNDQSTRFSYPAGKDNAFVELAKHMTAKVLMTEEFPLIGTPSIKKVNKLRKEFEYKPKLNSLTSIASQS